MATSKLVRSMVGLRETLVRRRKPAYSVEVVEHFKSPRTDSGSGTKTVIGTRRWRI